MSQGLHGINRSIKSIAFPLLILFVTGCAAPGVYMVKSLQSDTAVEPQQGYLVARVVNASGAPMPFNFLTIAPENLNESEVVKPIRLQSMEKVGGTTSIFLSAVDAGRYSIANIRSYYYNANYVYPYDRWAEGKIDMGTFSIEPGSVTDLGTLIYYPKPQEDVYLNTLVRSPSAGNEDLISAFVPWFGYSDKPSLSWDEDDYEDDRMAAYTSVVQNPVAYNDEYKTPNDDVVFLGKLGTLLKRSVDAEWELDAVDTDSDLQAIAQNKNGDVLIGGDHGALFYRPKNGEWQQQTIDPKYSVEVIQFYDETTVDIILKSSGRVVIKRGRFNQQEFDWETLGSFRPYRGWATADDKLYDVGASKVRSSYNHQIIRSVFVKEMQGQHYLFMTVERAPNYSLFNQTSHFEFTYDPATWIMKESSGFKSGIDYILNAGAISLGIKKPGFWSWDGRVTYFRFEESSDEWIKISTSIRNCLEHGPEVTMCEENGEMVNRDQTFNFLSAPVFSDELNGIAIIKHAVVSRNDKPKPKIVSTEDGGRTWKQTSRELPNDYCLKTVPEVKDVLLIACHGVSSDFYESRDGGETWEHSREHEHF